MIPKVIHYCWFGRGKLPRLALKCIRSWKKYLPDYEIKEWNEATFDVNSVPYTKEAY
jgi:mannosyltransferase OCH1-like enzyme